ETDGSGVPAPSLTRGAMLGLLNSAIGISAALRMAWPATPALPGADSGRMSPAFTWPPPIVALCGAWAPCGGDADDSDCKLCEQPATSVPAVASRPAVARRRVGKAAESLTCTSADTAVLPTAAPSAINHTAPPIRHIGGELLTE